MFVLVWNMICFQKNAFSNHHIFSLVHGALMSRLKSTNDPKNVESLKHELGETATWISGSVFIKSMNLL